MYYTVLHYIVLEALGSRSVQTHWGMFRPRDLRSAGSNVLGYSIDWQTGSSKIASHLDLARSHHHSSPLTDPVAFSISSSDLFIFRLNFQIPLCVKKCKAISRKLKREIKGKQKRKSKNAGGNSRGKPHLAA